MTAAKILHGGAVAAAARLYGGDPARWLDLSTGVNPNPPALPEIPLAVWNRLPDASLSERARRAAAHWYLRGVATGASGLPLPLPAPLPVPGTQALIQILPRLAPVGRAVAILGPTYGEYALCFARAGCVVEQIAALDAVRDDHGFVVVVNPNNPTGGMIAPDQLAALAGRLARQGARLHVDEAFGDSRPDFTLAHRAVDFDNLTVSRSFGKFFGLAGVRLGFVFAAPDILERVEVELGPWAVAGPALYLAADLMTRGGDAIAAAIQDRSTALNRILDAVGFARVGGTDLFQTIEHPRASALFEHLAHRQILTRAFDYAPTWLRIGLAPDIEGDERLAAALGSFQS